MTNDTSTIAGSLQEVIDRLETKIQAKGVSGAEFDPTTGILGLIDYIDDIQTGPTYSLTVTSDKNIISAASQETATLTATLSYGAVVVAGETISYSIEHDGTVLDSGSDTTDVNGEIEISYTGTGVGDVDVIVSYGNILQEIYEIEDCERYDTTVYQNTKATVLNWDLPSSFQMQFIFNSDSTTPSGSVENTCFLRFNNSNTIFVGKGSSSSRNIYLGGNTILNQIPVSTDVEYTLTYQNGTATLTDGTDTATASLTLTKLYSVNANSSSHAQVKNIKVKAL